MNPTMKKKAGTWIPISETKFGDIIKVAPNTPEEIIRVILETTYMPGKYVTVRCLNCKGEIETVFLSAFQSIFLASRIDEPW